MHVLEIVIVAVLLTIKIKTQTFSSIVSLQSSSYRHFCTGSILSKDWILTAGHCFTDKRYQFSRSFFVEVGTAIINQGTRYRIAHFYIHPNQSESIIIYRNDIAVVKLQTSIIFSSVVKSVYLGTITNQEEIPVRIGGWGRNYHNNALPRNIRYLQLETVNLNKCQELHLPRRNLVDKDTHICAMGGIGRTICFGDSGSPLFDVRTGYQIAVFSALEDCTGKFPALFMKVDAYVGWINDVTRLGLTL